MSQDKQTEAAESPKLEGDERIEEAMAEAVAAVEAREQPSEKQAAGKDASEAITESLIAAKKELEQALEQTKKEAGNMRDRWMRSAADLENYRKRAAREREDAVKFGTEKLLRDFLPIVDDLDRALQMVSGDSEGPAKQLVEGMVMVQKKVLSQLKKNGAEAFSSQGETFDPAKHEAVQQAYSPEFEAGLVMQELQRGFMLHDRLLRPAMVVVSLGAEPAKAESDGAS